MLNKIKAIKEQNNYSSNKNQIIVDNEKDMNNIFINYFKERQKYYKNINIRTPILDKIINETKICTELFVFQIKEEDYEIEPCFNVLKHVIEYFKSESVDEKKIGYICYKDNKQVIEAIYATLPSTEIYNKFKYRSDKFGNSSKKIRENYFKARSLAFQYFINLLLVETFKYDELPRVFFLLKNDNCAENEEDTENQENIERIYTKDQLPMDEKMVTSFLQMKWL